MGVLRVERFLLILFSSSESAFSLLEVLLLVLFLNLLQSLHLLLVGGNPFQADECLPSLDLSALKVQNHIVAAGPVQIVGADHVYSPLDILGKHLWHLGVVLASLKEVHYSFYVGCH